jgi:glycosyltransferase involved in cell wall biosynthesis
MHLKPKIVHIIDTFTKGGAEILLVGSIPELTDFEHHVIYLYPTKTPIVNSIPGIENIICLNYTGPLDSIRIIKELNNYISIQKPNIIHTHLYFSSICIRFVKTENIQVIQTYHSKYYRIKYPKFKARVSKQLMKLVDRYSQNKKFIIIHVSKTQQAANDLDVKIKSSEVMYNYIEDVFYKERNNLPATFKRKLNIISVGNLKTEKNHIVFLEALRQLPHLPLHVNICGHGIDEHMLQAYVNKYNLPVTFLGSKENIAELLDQHDLFVSCAIIEGFGISVAEAMASELPLLISDIPTLKEITNNKSVYFNARNSTDLAQKIESFYLNPTTTNQKVKDCKVIALNYKKNIYIESLDALYKKIISDYAS